MQHSFPFRFNCLMLALCLTVPFLFCACSPAQNEPSQDDPSALCLAQNAESDYRVIIPADASEDVKKMADEFVYYFEKITGVVLSIYPDTEQPVDREISIGNTNRAINASVDYASLGEEELVYITDDSALLLTGGSDRAIAYAVYGFFEDYCDVRYFSPTYESVPKSTTLKISKDIRRTEEPVFAFRTINGAGEADEKWAVKMRFNSRQSLGSENYRREFYVGGGIGYADWFVHTITKLAEMPATVNGVYNTAQPCLTDETVYQTVLKNVRIWLETYPDADILSISQNDGGDEASMCSCENCKAIYNQYGKVQSALWIHFVSRIANELADEYPDVYFDTLAYSFTLMAPTGIEIPDNVIVRIAPIGTCYQHGAVSCADDRGTARAQRISDRLKKSLEGWKTLTDNLYVWDYSAPFNNYWAPLCNFDAMRENIAYYAQNGVNGLFMQGAENTPFAELSAYLTAKLLWDPDMSDREYEKTLTEFIEGYYTADADPILEYITLVDSAAETNHYSTHAVLCRDYLPISTIENEDGTVSLDTGVLIDPMKQCFDRAEASATDEEQKLHLKKARMQVKYYELIALFYLEDNFENAVLDTEYRTELARSLWEDATVCGVTQISESVPTLPEEPNFTRPPLEWATSGAQIAEQY